MKVFTLIGGVNGAGKSSLTGSLKAERTDLGVIVDPNNDISLKNGFAPPFFACLCKCVIPK